MKIEVCFLFVDTSGDVFPFTVTFAGTPEEMYEQMLEFLIDCYRVEKLLLKSIISVTRV